MHHYRTVSITLFAILVFLLAMSACTLERQVRPIDAAGNPAGNAVVPAETGAERDLAPTPTLAAALAVENTTADTTATPAVVGRSLPDMGLAPEIENEIWLNSAPLRLADLRGKVVMVEFWTFGCINCQRVIPYMNEWQAQYAGDDFVIISVHYPEFGYEENIDNVRAALQEYGIEYAVAIDNDGLTWRAYSQRFWPTRYLIDKNEHIRYKHIGEGAYQETEAIIQQLIAEPPAASS